MGRTLDQSGAQVAQALMSSALSPAWLRRSIWLGLLPAVALLLLLMAPLGSLVLAGWAGDVNLPGAVSSPAWSLWSP